MLTYICIAEHQSETLRLLPEDIRLMLRFLFRFWNYFNFAPSSWQKLVILKVR